MIPIFIGHDRRETVGLHVCTQTLIENTEARLSITALTGLQGDASTSFSRERWRIPALCGYSGWAVWMESDMMLRPGADIEEVLPLANMVPSAAVALVPHDYETKFPVKFFGQPNPSYPRKNWSSFMLINCRHAVWRRIDELGLADKAVLHRFPEVYVGAEQGGTELFRPGDVVALPRAWNHLVGEFDHDPAARLLHFTIGIPPLWTYTWREKLYVQEWYDARARCLRAHE